MAEYALPNRAAVAQPSHAGTVPGGPTAAAPAGPIRLRWWSLGILAAGYALSCLTGAASLQPWVAALVAGFAGLNFAFTRLAHAGGAYPRLEALLAILDVAGIGVVCAASGGIQSPFAGLLFLHTLAVIAYKGGAAGVRTAGAGVLVLAALAVRDTAGLAWPLGGFAFDGLAHDGAATWSRFAITGLSLLVHAGAAAALARRLTQNEQQLSHTRRQILSIHDISSSLNLTVRAHEVVSSLAAGVLREFHYEACAFYTVDGGVMKLAHLRDRHGGSEAEMPLEEDLRRVVEDGRETVLNGQFAVVPMQSRGRTMGLLVALDRRGIGADELKALCAVAVQAVAAMEASAATEESRRVEQIDAASGVLNGEAFGARLALEIRRSVRFRHPVAVVIWHLGAVAETLGRPADAAWIHTMAHAIRDGLRDIDLLGRVGEFEFAALLPETSEAAARQAAERIREELGLVAAPPARRTQFVAAGVAMLAAGEEDSPRRLLQRAREEAAAAVPAVALAGVRVA